MVTQKDIIDFIEENTDDKVLNYYEKLCDKQKELQQRINRLSIYFILTSLVFYVLPFATNSSIQVGPVNLSNNSIIYKLIPLFFSYIFLEFSIVSNHKGEVIKTLKLISLVIYKQKVDANYLESDNNLNFFTRLVLPFSFWSELYKALNYKKGLGCFGALIFFPSVIILFLPFYFQYVCLKFLIETYWDDWITKGSVFLSIWLIIITIYFYVKTISHSYSIAKNEQRL